MVIKFYNNCHEYINSYRLDALKSEIRGGSITAVGDCFLVGFGSEKTARTCFERAEGRSLDDYLRENAR